MVELSVFIYVFQPNAERNKQLYPKKFKSNVMTNILHLFHCLNQVWPKGAGAVDLVMTLETDHTPGHKLFFVGKH